MIKHLQLISFATIMVFASCKKSDKKAYSTWYINDEELTSQNITPIVWPHISISTMKRMPEPLLKAGNAEMVESTGNTPGVPQL